MSEVSRETLEFMEEARREIIELMKKVYTKPEKKMAEEYNLSWQEAVNKMAQGFVVEGEKFKPHKIKLIDGLFYYYDDINKGWSLVSHAINAPSGATRKWKVIEDPKLPSERKKQEKEYTFKEAFLGHPEGTKFSSPNGFIYFIKGNYLIGEDGHSVKLISLLHLMEIKFTKVADKPEVKENGLGLLQSPEIDGFVTISGKNEDKILKALQIYTRLLAHSLVVKIEGDVTQYGISLDNDRMALYTPSWGSINAKIQELSPFFSTREDAKKAIDDIGEDNLIFMFQTLKGVK